MAIDTQADPSAQTADGEWTTALEYELTNNDSVVGMHVQILGVADGGDTAYWTKKGVVKRMSDEMSATMMDEGSPVKDPGASGWDVRHLLVDHKLVLQVRGSDGVTVRWWVSLD